MRLTSQSISLWAHGETMTDVPDENERGGSPFRVGMSKRRLRNTSNDEQEEETAEHSITIQGSSTDFGHREVPSDVGDEQESGIRQAEPERLGGVKTCLLEEVDGTGGEWSTSCDPATIRKIFPRQMKNDLPSD